MRTLAILAIALLGASACSDRSTAPTPEPNSASEPIRDPAAIERGRQIYVTGKSPSGAAIDAVLAGDVVVDAAKVPCVGCHGEDGRGRPEGGMEPSDITWEQLGKPYGGRGGDGREHEAYDAAALRKAIAMGIDPSGNRLAPTMPRHRMALADMDSLVAYLETLGEHHAIGVDEQTITITTLQPPGGSTTARAVLTAFFSEVNARGGVFGRRLELDVVDLPADASVDMLASAWATKPGFAVLAPQLGRGEAELLRWLADAGVPVIGPATLYPDGGTPPLRSVFHVDGGIPAQAHALAEFAARSAPSNSDDAPASRRGVVVFPDREPERALGQQLIEDWQRAGIDARSLALAGESASESSARLVALQPEFVVWLGPAELALAVLTTLAQSEAEPPRVLVPGSLPIGDPFSLPIAWNGRLFAAYPWLPDDLAPAALRDFQALVETHDLPRTERPTQLASLAAATILLEALTRAGRAVTRESLIRELELLREFTTGLTPPITFGPNRHIGLDDPRIVEFELEHDRMTRVE